MTIRDTFYTILQKKSSDKKGMRKLRKTNNFSIVQRSFQSRFTLNGEKLNKHYTFPLYRSGMLLDFLVVLRIFILLLLLYIIYTFITNKCFQHLHSKIQFNTYISFNFDKYKYI